MTPAHPTLRHRTARRHMLTPGAPRLAASLTFCLSLSLALCWPAMAQAPDSAAAPSASVSLPDTAVLPTPAPTEATPTAPAVDACRPLSDKAMAADMKAVLAQSQQVDLAEQARLYDAAVALWSQALSQCEGRAKDRAQRNLADTQKTQAALAEQLGAGPQCTSAHKDASTLQDIARQALSERRWAQASVLFRKAEHMWESAAERCTGSQQEAANRRREQSEIDGHNAEHCAPLFEKAREQTQKLRTGAAGLTREAKQDASQVAETSWREAASACKGATVQESARNNAQALARERGTPWVARVAPAPSVASPVTATSATAPAGATAAASAVLNTLRGTGPQAEAPAKPTALAPAPAAQVVGTAPATPTATEFSAGTTRFSGQFVRDAGATTFSGHGKIVWAQGDVYVGDLVQGQRHGRGNMTWANGQNYDGDWVRDLATGQAKLRFANGNQFEGQVQDGIPQGTGTLRHASGDTYTGQLNAGEPHGKGVYRWKNGQQFDGEWRNGSPNGEGKLKFATGNHYEGSVVNGVPQGPGRLLFASGDQFVGQLANGQPDGQGTFTWTNGDAYTGQWLSGKKHGQGKFTWKSGAVWEGRFENDQQTHAEQPRPAN